MSVKYSVVKQKYDITGKKDLKYYAKAKSSGETDFNSFCKEISDASSINKGEILAVLYGCIQSMSRALSEGRIVRLGEFGSFQIGISSEGTLSEKAFNSKKITKAKILFRPGKDLTEMLKNLTYQKI
jgi:predicted histone-like DNA-binding protein